MHGNQGQTGFRPNAAYAACFGSFQKLSSENPPVKYNSCNSAIENIWHHGAEIAQKPPILLKISPTTAETLEVVDHYTHEFPRMDRFANANLISLFDFYLASLFVINSYRRRSIYWDGIKLTFATLSKRRLLGRVKEHKDALFTREVMRAMFMAFSLMAIQWLCSRVIYPDANITLAQLAETWWKPVLLVVAAIPMLCVDIYFLVRVGQFDRVETEKYLAQAENWLGWRARAVRLATIGIMNPRSIVDREVRSALQLLGQNVGWVMWWMSIQIICRVAFGLTIWLLWAFQ